jgi:tetratricopeptide (TPR) repeat protein
MAPGARAGCYPWRALMRAFAPPIPTASAWRALACAGLVLASAAQAREAAPLLDGMGAYTHANASPVPRAQRYFDQGMVLAWGFNAAESARSFEAATRADPKCAICFWGLAWSLGPTINADMHKADAARVQTAVRRADALSVNASPRHRALIAALAARHPKPGVVDEERYAERMRALARSSPRDADVLTLAAEAQLNLHPYDWWERDGTPKSWTPELEALLAAALNVAPEHPGANHYWIHLMESSATPGRAAPSAAKLETLVPGSGHLLHMPAHIYMRVGRYAEASAANERALAADERYLAQLQAQNAYRVGYAAHNPHFLWAAAAMEGRSRAAIDAARAAYRVACGPAPSLRDGTLQHYFVLEYYALVRFGRWDEILKTTLPPDTEAPYPLAAWHFARGMALARTGKPRDARKALEALEQALADPTLEDAKVKRINPAANLARIAHLTLRAELAAADRKPRDAIELLKEAVAIEDGLAADEPHLWLAPTRHAYGAALLRAGRAAEAESAYREDLARYPENGWSLYGLSQSVALQGRAAEAKEIDERFRAAWRRADFDLRTLR